MRVLVIDDNPDDRQLVRRELEALFPYADIVELATKSQLDAALSAGDVDLVVTDLALRWGSGREVLEQVKAERPGCPVVMFTGTGDEMTAVELLKSGLDDYVVKSARQLPRLRVSLKMVVEAARNRSALSAREAQLTAALAHKSIIVRELHHRVRNNLQAITSLLQLRARTKGGELAEQLDDLAGRMRVLSAVQTRIYKTDQFDRVDFRMVLEDIMESLASVYGNGNLTLVRQFAGPLDLDIEQAMPLALLCYELVLNALKHAWPDRRAGRLIVSLRTWNATPEICITDNGVGFIEEKVVQGMGSRLVRGLAGEAGAEVQTITRPGNGVVRILRLV